MESSKGFFRGSHESVGTLSWDTERIGMFQKNNRFTRAGPPKKPVVKATLTHLLGHFYIGVITSFITGRGHHLVWKLSLLGFCC